MALPNFLLIGAPKCGTTSLYHYLQQHPDVFLPTRKELHYFSSDAMKRFTAGPGDTHIFAHLCSTLEEYETYYEQVVSQAAIGDVSPSYLYFSEVCERIQRELNHPKILVILRDPIEKAFSQYMHLVRDHRETLTFNDALLAEEERIQQGWGALWRYAESSLYAPRIQTYLDAFGADRVKILLFEELSQSPQTVMQGVLQFLEVEQQGFSFDTSTVYNRSGKPRSTRVADFVAKPNLITTLAKKWVPRQLRGAISRTLMNMNTGAKGEIDEASRAYLHDYFARDVGEVEAIVGNKLNWL